MIAILLLSSVFWITSMPEKEVERVIECLVEKSSPGAKSKFFSPTQLENYSKIIVKEAKKIGFSPYTFVAWIYKESNFVYTAVSKYNRVKPGKRPWKTLHNGLDWGLTQIHCYSKFCRNKAQTLKLKDPEHAIATFRIWLGHRIKFCKRRPRNSRCRQIRRATGDTFYNSDPHRIRFVMRKINKCKKRLSIDD
jgi:hypothetical protein